MLCRIIQRFASGNQERGDRDNMVQDIIRNETFLAEKSEIATKEDLSAATDLLDTLKAYRHRCVGLAANMIGIRKRIIAIRMEDTYLVMLNPEILKKSARTYKTAEGCLSLDGERETLRHDWIEVKFRDMEFKKQRQKFSGLTAQIIQHEIDHCDGILI